MWYPQGRTLGGSTSINAMIYIRGQREDYERWAALGNKEWGYDQVLPFFRKAEHNERLNDEFHGSDGAMNVTEQVQHNELSKAFVRAAQELGSALHPRLQRRQPGRCGLLRRHPAKGPPRKRIHGLSAPRPQAPQSRRSCRMRWPPECWSRTAARAVWSTP